MSTLSCSNSLSSLNSAMILGRAVFSDSERKESYLISLSNSSNISCFTFLLFILARMCCCRCFMKNYVIISLPSQIYSHKWESCEQYPWSLKFCLWSDSFDCSSTPLSSWCPTLSCLSAWSRWCSCSLKCTEFGESVAPTNPSNSSSWCPLN